MRGGLTAEEYRWKRIGKWGPTSQLPREQRCIGPRQKLILFLLHGFSDKQNHPHSRVFLHISKCFHPMLQMFLAASCKQLRNNEIIKFSILL